MVRSIEQEGEYNIVLVRFFLSAALMLNFLPAFAQNSAKVSSRRVVLVRGTKGTDFKQATIRYPVVTGLPDRAAQKQAQSALSLKSALGQSLEEHRKEFRDSSWLDAIDYAVAYNRNGLLDIAYTITGTGAYPSGATKHVVISLKTGKRLRARDLFTQVGMSQIAALLDRKLQSEMKQAIAEAEKQGEDIRAPLEAKRFEVKDLSHFSINDRGVTFFYDFEFPHVIQALEPKDRYLLTYAQLKPYIPVQSPLRVFVR